MTKGNSRVSSRVSEPQPEYPYGPRDEPPPVIEHVYAAHAQEAQNGWVLELHCSAGQQNLVRRLLFPTLSRMGEFLQWVATPTDERSTDFHMGWVPLVSPSLPRPDPTSPN